jgi:hypothetical protein
MYCRAVKIALSVIFWLAVFFIYLTPIELGDIWWHLSAGRWIWERFELPGADPFSFTPVHDETFVLRAFWLCQVLLYGASRLAGIQGLVVLKAAVFTFTLAVLYRRARSSAGIPAIAGYLLIVPAAYLSVQYDEIRPQTFSFIFFSVLLFALEKGRRTMGGEKHSHQLYTWSLPLLMTVWANMHPGFVIGCLFIVLAGVEHALRSLRRGSERVNRGFLAGCLAAVCASAFLNPNGPEAFRRSYAMLAGSLRGGTSIHEHLPAREFAAFTASEHYYYVLIGFIALGALSFLYRFARDRRIPVTHACIFAALAFISLKTFRMGFFFAIAVTPSLAGNVAPLFRAQPWSATAARSLVAGASVAAALFLLLPRTLLTRPLMNPDIFPEKALSFLERERLPGNVYHPYEWGGYFSWRLYPRYMVFVDGRAVGPLREHRLVLSAGLQWEEILRKHDVNTVVYWPLLPYKKHVPPLLFALLRDEGWSPVYWDLRSVIFVRKPLAERPIGKDSVWKLLASMIRNNIAEDPDEPANHVALGELYLERGLARYARDSFRRALALEPANKQASSYLEALE